MLKKTLTYVNILVLAILFGCGSGDEPTPPVTEPMSPPESALLVFPLENSECTEGTNFTNTQSDVTFEWNDAENANSFTLVVKNLSSQSTNQYSSATSQRSVTLLRATPYSWYVISENETNETAQSETWKFYNAGVSQTNYAPFPAELVAPNMGTAFNAATTNVNLEWNGSDVDNDIESFSVLLNTSSPPSTTVLENSNETNYTANVTSGNTYYWQVITFDANGNNSRSEIFQFKTE